MRVADESNVDLLRKKAIVLERENERLSAKVESLYREVLQLKGMAPEQVSLNLPGLLQRVTSVPKRSALTRPGSERRINATEQAAESTPQTGHGPTEQVALGFTEETHELPDSERQCPSCGGELEAWDGHEDDVEVMDMVERHWLVRQCKVKKYRCKCGKCIKSAQGPTRLLKGGRYTPEVAITTAIGKYLDHLPLERQAAQAQRLGAKVTSQALWDQVSALSELLSPTVQAIKDAVLSEPVVGADESPFLFIRKGGAKKWQAWQIASPVGAYFEILRAKSSSMGERLLGGYTGVVLADGAKVYESLARDGPFVLSNCWSHARRRVLKAEGEAPGQVGEFLDLVAQLYAVERKAVRISDNDEDERRGYRHRMDLEKLGALRDTESRQVITAIKDWVLEQRCVPGGELKKALEYVAKRWTPLTRFLDNPNIPLDNNDVERGYIGLAIGRRNYVGARSVDGAKAAARFYTIFETAKRVGVDPAAYLRYATRTTFTGDTPQLPHRWESK